MNSRSRRLTSIFNIEGARQRARRVLPRVLFDYVDGGADDEITLIANTNAFRSVTFCPRTGNDITKPKLDVSLFGTELSLPILLAPCGGVRLIHPDGDRAIAFAAGVEKTAAVFSSASATPIEEIAKVATGPVWFQLYLHGDRSVTQDLVRRAQDAGFGTLFVTIDTPVQGNRERDRRHGVRMPLAPSARNVVHFAPQLARRPRWTLGYIRDGLPTSFGSLPPSVSAKSLASTPMTWSEVAWVRGIWHGPLVVKGILTASDARLAVEHGADGVVVSNHGGRQLDGTPPTLSVLPTVKDAIGSRAQILMDGGIRRGSDAVKAVALGADAVMIGRPYLYGLAAGGSQGVRRVLSILRADLERTLILLGAPSIASVDHTFVEARPAAFLL